MSNRNDDDPKRPAGTARKLLLDAHKHGALSAASAATLDVLDLGAQIQAGLGIAVDDVAASEVVLVTMMPDDSQSIAAAGNTAAVRDGHNLVIEALKRSRQAGDVFVTTQDLIGNTNSTVRSLDRATGAYASILQNLPYRIVGAGVSTCAPVVIGRELPYDGMRLPLDGSTMFAQ